MSIPQHFPYPSWYLNAVCGEGQWSLITTRDGSGRTTGILPYRKHRRWGIPIITPPPLSPRLGPCLFPSSDLKPSSLLDFQWQVLTELARQLPSVAYARIQWPYDLTYGLPWQQLGWRQEARYSYCIDLEQDTDSIWQAFKARTRTTIRKAEKELHIEASEDWQALYRLVKAVFQHRKTKEQVSQELIGRVFAAASDHQKGRLTLAIDEQGRMHGALFLIWDTTSAYNLLLGSEPALRSSGATSLLLWEAIQFARESGLATFDFEGSHLPGVEPFFRSFGGQARVYYQFSRFMPGRSR